MIRRANKNDSINLAALSIQVWLHSYATEGIRKEISDFVIGTFTEQYFKDLLNNPSYRILVFIKEDHLVGYIMANLESFWQDQSNGYEIDKLYVQEHFQGQGIGYSLLRDMLMQFKRRGAVNVSLNTLHDNMISLSLYHKAGFKRSSEEYTVYQCMAK